MEGVHTWRVSIHGGCPYMESVHTWRVSIHGGCPYMEGIRGGSRIFVRGGHKAMEYARSNARAARSS